MGLPRITATALSFRLVPIACHASYPRKSENASPPGTLRVYLSCAELAKPPNTASQATVPIVHRLLRFIAVPLEFSEDRHSHRTWLCRFGKRARAQKTEP